MNRSSLTSSFTYICLYRKFRNHAHTCTYNTYTVFPFVRRITRNMLELVCANLIINSSIVFFSLFLFSSEKKICNICIKWKWCTMQRTMWVSLNQRIMSPATNKQQIAKFNEWDDCDDSFNVESFSKFISLDICHRYRAIEMKGKLCGLHWDVSTEHWAQMVKQLLLVVFFFVRACAEW